MSNINKEFDNLLKIIEDLIKEKDKEVKGSSTKQLNDIKERYEFLDAIKGLLRKMVDLYVNIQILKDIVNILNDQLEILTKAMKGQGSGILFKTDEKILMENILNNNERIHPNILNKIVNANQQKWNTFHKYLSTLNKLLNLNFVLNPRSRKYTLRWDYKTDTELIRMKGDEIEKKNKEFKSAVDFKYLKQVLEENLNIFDGCYCNSKCSFQDKPEIGHWCYTQHEKCKRGNQSQTFAKSTKTCNPYKNNNNKLSSVEREFYTIGNHDMVYKTNRAIICTKNEKGLTKHSGKYKCNQDQMMTLNQFIKIKRKEYKDNYKKINDEYYRDLKLHLITSK